MLASRTISEDFMTGEDEGLEEAMALADSLERAPKNVRNAKSAPKSKGSTQQQKPKRKPGSQSKVQVAQTDPIIDSSKTLSESFIIGEDDDMDQALAIVERLETSSSLQAGRRLAPTKRKNSSATAADNGSRRCKGSPRSRSKLPTDQPQNDEDNSIEDITSPVEEDAPQRPPTPPARQWKLNMHEVDENEDYGGALFSAEERKILGMVTPRISTSILSVVSFFATLIPILTSQ